MGRDEDDDSPRKKKKKFFSKRNVFLIVLVIGIVLGAAVQHFYLEPLLEPAKMEQLKLCKSQNELLNQENQECLNKLYDASSGESCTIP